MKVLTADDRITSHVATAVFLIGPTPRDPDTPSWRPEAIDHLRDVGFTGTVLVPERKVWKCDYIDQVEWEKEGLDWAARTGCVAAWVPRDLKKMPAFTTNVEFGLYVGCGRFVYGRPLEAPKMRYLDWLYEETTDRSPCSSLYNTMRVAKWMATDRL